MKNITDVLGRRHKDIYYVMDMEYDSGKRKSSREISIVPEILNICFLKCDANSGECIAEYRYKLKPERKLTEYIKEFLKITEEDYADGLTHEAFLDKVNADIGADLLAGVEVFNAGDDDYYVFRRWAKAYLEKHSSIRQYEQCPFLLLTDENCCTLHNVTEVLSLITVYNNRYLICGDMDLSVKNLSVLYGLEQKDEKKHEAVEDARELLRIIRFAGEYLLKSSEKLICLETLSWVTKEKGNPAMEIIQKQEEYCKKHWQYLMEQYSKWVLALEVEEIDWNAAGIPVDEWSGEPLGIRYTCEKSRMMIAQWSRLAYKKPRVVEEYFAWQDWCMWNNRWQIGA